jgi:uncharacterized Zn finger protein (UPF0148 family)
MTEQRCPSCGADLPAELGQHALTPISGLVKCPTCGAKVTLEHAETGSTSVEEADSVPDTAGDPESFSGEETVEGVMDELERKPGGPKEDS